ncbi:ubiquitin carboxyl-terminal hydrolase 48-like isoform X2 [Cloeon dipterum]|uniref:ubiquitin carboxyl-terminal hydrolase 48-like isoform X2 n=1 Tax=Cloeon dipterum TaxID=197152 RepID=UPI00321FC141
MSKSKWPWAKEVKGVDDVRPTHLEDAYCLVSKPCNRGKHRPCKYNPRCVDVVLERHWARDEPPRSKTQTRLKDDKVRFAGLKNAGALCYCNVFLQLWFHNPHFRDAIYKWHPVEDGEMTAEEFVSSELYVPPAHSIIGQLQLILAEMEFGNSNVVDPIALAEALNLNQTAHQDPQEFATLFLNCRSYIADNITHKLLMTEYHSVIRCNECGQANTTSNSMLNFELPLSAKKQTVSEIIKQTMDGETLDGDNQYFCTRCAKKCDALKKLEFTKLPPTFMVQVLRSEFNREKNQITKLKTFLEIPQQLELGAFAAKDAPLSHSSYKLSAVVVHLGTEVSGGHYIVNIRDAKSGKWFSFNDVSVENMNKDCLVEGAKSCKASKVEADSLLSNIAYLVVYDSVAAASVEPELPAWLLPVIETRNRELELSEGLLASEELQRTTQWQSNKEYMTHMQQIIGAKTHNAEFVPLKWLCAWAEHPQTKTKIDNEPFLCPHKRLAFTKVCATRLVSTNAAEELFEMYGGGPRLALKQSLCHECVAAHCNLLQLNERLEKDAKWVSQDVKRPGAPAFWVSKSGFARWKGLARARIECRLAECEDKDEKEDKEESGDDADKPQPVQPAQVPPPAPSTDEPDPSTFVFNSDLLCQHGGFTTNENVRRLVSAEVFERLRAYLPDALELPQDAATCKSCQEVDLLASKRQVQLEEVARQLREKVPALLSFPNATNPNNKHVAYETRASRPDTLFVVSFDFVLELSRFARNPGKASAPSEISNASLMCKHQKLHVDLGLNGRFEALESDKRGVRRVSVAEEEDCRVLVQGLLPANPQGRAGREEGRRALAVQETQAQGPFRDQGQRPRHPSRSQD